MEILWSTGEGNVRDVAKKVERPLAYTTVMTTLDRLFKKGLLDRRRFNRAYVYSPRLSRGELLISSFLEEAGHDPVLLDELERKIKSRREELEGRQS
jgi:predicted transcriptional regulator